MATFTRTCLTVFLICYSLSPTWGQGQPSQTFGTGDISNFLNDENFVKRQLSCVIGEASCDNFGNQLKLAIPEVLNRNCRSCSVQQASNARRLIGFAQARYPKEWQKIQTRFRDDVVEPFTIQLGEQNQLHTGYTRDNDEDYENVE